MARYQISRDRQKQRQKTALDRAEPMLAGFSLAGRGSSSPPQTEPCRVPLPPLPLSAADQIAEEKSLTEKDQRHQ
jgi:hypothetical protein